MEAYILDKNNLDILSIQQPVEYEINLDEETNGVSTFVLTSFVGANKGNILVLNGLYKQLIFVIDDVTRYKDEKCITLYCLDISNIFDRKIIAKNESSMQTNGIENFIATAISDNFVNSDDEVLNINYIDILIHSNTLKNVATNSDNGLFNLHTFITNCRQYKNIFTEFSIKLSNNQRRMQIDISQKNENTLLVDTTLEEVTNYNKVYEVDPVTKVQAYMRDTNTVYNLYLKTDRTTTTDKNDTNRMQGRIETISCENFDSAKEEALNVIKSNSYKHLVEFSISKNSKLINVSDLTIGKPIKIKTSESIYDSYISAISINENNFISYKTGNLRIDFSDKQRQQKQNGTVGNKLDVSGGIVTGAVEFKSDVKSKNTDLIHIGSMELYNSVDVTNQGYTFLVGCYSEDLISGVFNGVQPPNGYKKAYRISAMITTSGEAEAGVSINNKVLFQALTWSGNTFQTSKYSDFFYSWKDFPTQNVEGYSGTGLNLQAYLDKKGTDNIGKVNHITVHGYFIREEE